MCRFSLSLSLSLSHVHSRSRAPGSRPERERYERSRRPSSARPRPDTARAPLSLPLPLPLSRSLFLNRAARLIPPLSLSLSLSFYARVEYSSAYIHTLSPSRIIMFYPTHSPSVSYDSAVSIERAFRRSSRPSSAQTLDTTQGESPARLNSVWLSTWTIEGLLPPPTLAHFSQRSSVLLFLPISPRSAAFAALPSRDYFLPSHRRPNHPSNTPPSKLPVVSRRRRDRDEDTVNFEFIGERIAIRAPRHVTDVTRTTHPASAK